MTDRVRCFWLDPVERFELSLRRYTSTADTREKCTASGYGYHNASTVIGQAGIEACPVVSEGRPVHGDHWPHDDARWPAKCACGYTFVLGDEWQFNPDQLFRRSDSGELVTLRGAPIGAMWDAHWMADNHSYKRIDGVTLCVRTPGGEWCVDGPSYNDSKVSGPGWTRTGKVPDITAKPSIHIPGKYHGWLTDGWLTDC